MLPFKAHHDRFPASVEWQHPVATALGFVLSGILSQESFGLVL
jgi:hypothetical protein